MTGWISDRRRPIPDHLRMMLGHLDGQEKFTYVIWRAPNPESIIVTPQDGGDGFMQAAGSADQMTVEVRLPAPDGETHLYTVGRPEPADGTTLIPISQTRAVRVFSNEVFTADEAAVIFYTYYLTDAVAQPYVLRELDLSQELSEER
ncbi:hypothetical protein [Microbacterium paraoxydans]|uniref:Uncharacterized protein n=1 Tax=Microbacterium paraoxydans TaxID=199592 RepID=A0A1H1MG56_9MICO|nr:hypothetical protein [Microbacterium paraoxydans]SDR85821.1 hypothetical protein SAMN04489809_0509 [Microbacterium paraoxydans]